MDALTTFSYAGSKITFANESGVRVNATQMAKVFNKRPNDWMRLDYTKEFLNALSVDTQIPASALIQTVKGGNGEQGTWMHEDVALEFARWLSPKFAIWCNRQIKELLTAPKQPVKAEVLPPPIENQTVTPPLVECIDGKSVTTSRKLAEVLGRKHDSILGTIKNNLHRRTFKYGNFTTRDYSSGPSGHGYEFLITRKGLETLSGVMRHNAKKRIAEAYADAWALSPAKALPGPAVVEQPEEESSEDTVRELARWIDELRADLRKTRETMKMYAGMYENEKKRRLRNGDMAGYWHDLYEDLLWRVVCGTEGAFDERLAAHREFVKRLSGRS